MQKISRQEAIDRGLNRYFTGEACKRGHKSERWTLASGCIACIEEAKAAERERYLAAQEAAGGR